MSLAIHTEHLRRHFGPHRAVQDVSLHVPERSVYGFLGRNGAGKTTTLKMLLGLLRPDSGRALIAGIDIGRERIRAARRVGALLEAQGFYLQLSGRANLELCCLLRDCPRSEVDRTLEITEMTRHASRRVADYSLGMRQRLGVARAMLGAPPVLLLDEPTNGLDPEGMADMRAFLRELPARTGATVLLCSHLLGEIEQTATHVGILSRGRLVLEGDLATLRAGLAPELVVRVDDLPRADAITRGLGFEAVAQDNVLHARLPLGADVRDATAALARALCAANLSLYAIGPREQSLERLYHHTTTHDPRVADALCL